MFKKSPLMVLLAITLVAFFATEAPALLRGGGGGSRGSCDCDPNTAAPQCVLCGKCVEGYVLATGLGNVENTPTSVVLSLFVHKECINGTIEGEECVGGYWEYPSWAVACGNPGSNSWTAPGINLAYYAGDFGGIESIDPGAVPNNGRYYVLVSAEPTPAMLADLRYACPNLHWIARDALPCENTDAFFEEIIKVDGVCYIRSTLLYKDCYILGCPASVEWDFVNQTFVPIPYICDSAPEGENFTNNPILYSSKHQCYICPGVWDTKSESCNCTDGLDNDGDGDIDCEDDDCSSNPACQ